MFRSGLRNGRTVPKYSLASSEEEFGVCIGLAEFDNNARNFGSLPSLVSSSRYRFNFGPSATDTDERRVLSSSFTANCPRAVL